MTDKQDFMIMRSVVIDASVVPTCSGVFGILSSVQPDSCCQLEKVFLFLEPPSLIRVRKTNQSPSQSMKKYKQKSAISGREGKMRLLKPCEGQTVFTQPYDVVESVPNTQGKYYCNRRNFRKPKRKNFVL